MMEYLYYYQYLILLYYNIIYLLNILVCTVRICADILHSSRWRLNIADLSKIHYWNTRVTTPRVYGMDSTL